jgi:hypothetical protein
MNTFAEDLGRRGDKLTITPTLVVDVLRGRLARLNLTLGRH